MVLWKRGGANFKRGIDFQKELRASLDYAAEKTWLRSCKKMVQETEMEWTRKKNKTDRQDDRELLYEA